MPEMYSVILSNQSIKNLTGIVEYIAAENPDAADKIGSELVNLAMSLEAVLSPLPLGTHGSLARQNQTGRCFQRAVLGARSVSNFARGGRRYDGQGSVADRMGAAAGRDQLGDWKAVFQEQRAPGNLNIWQNPFTPLRLPKIFNLRMDPYERADITSDQYNDWLIKNAYLTGIATLKASAFLETFIDYPPSQRPASFSIDQARKKVDKAIEESFKKRGIE
jgi:hypothetical protein